MRLYLKSAGKIASDSHIWQPLSLAWVKNPGYCSSSGSFFLLLLLLLLLFFLLLDNFLRIYFSKSLRSTTFELGSLIHLTMLQCAIQYLSLGLIIALTVPCNARKL